MDVTKLSTKKLIDYIEILRCELVINARLIMYKID